MSSGDQVSMFYGAKPYIFANAKALRANMTVSEQYLWQKLKGKNLLGLRFRPQHPIDVFIADFYCHSIKLVIEVDGGVHENREQREYDIGREAELNALGIDVIRFKNEKVINHIDEVVEEIKRCCQLKMEQRLLADF